MWDTVRACRFSDRRGRLPRPCGQRAARMGRDVAKQATTANYANCIRLRYNENMCVSVCVWESGMVW